jgi:hypothetical protein
MSNWNPLSFLGLRRRGDAKNADDEEDLVKDPDSPMTSKSGMALNRRGLPARKRKLNSLIYGSDDLVSIPIKSPKKRGPKTPIKSNVDVDVEAADNSAEDLADSLPSSPVKSPSKKKAKKVVRRSSKKIPTSEVVVKNEPFDPELSSPEKKSAQRLGVALRNLLKLPKGHKWMCYEFFYSNIDKVLFEGENDFMVCLRESFPQLKTRRLTRVEWCKVRCYNKQVGNATE